MTAGWPDPSDPQSGERFKRQDSQDKPHDDDAECHGRGQPVVLPGAYVAVDDTTVGPRGEGHQEKAQCHDRKGIEAQRGHDVAVKQRIDRAQRPASGTVNAEKGFRRTRREYSAWGRRIRDPHQDTRTCRRGAHEEWATEASRGECTDRQGDQYDVEVSKSMLRAPTAIKMP